MGAVLIEEKLMRSSILNKKHTLVCLGVILILAGAAGLLLSQTQPIRQVIRVGFDGAYLGVEMQDVTAENMAKYKLTSEAGVIVRSVEKGSPAEAAHLQDGDVILEYAGQPVFSSSALTRLVQETPIDRTVNLVVSRDGKKLTLTAKVGERPGPASGLGFVAPDLSRQFNFGGKAFQFSVPRDGGRFGWSVPSRPQLGVTVETITDQMASFLGVTGKKGVLVNSVTAGSPAASALKAGDVILSLDGKLIATPQDLTQALTGKTPGSKVVLQVVRDKKEISVTIEFPKAPSVQRGIIL